VDAGSAKLGEILLPPDDKAFSFSEMPVPDLIKAKEDKSHVLHDGMGNVPLTRPAKPGEPVADLRSSLPTFAPLASGPAAGGVPTAAPTLAAAPADPAAGAPPAAGAAGQPPRVPLTVADLAEETIEEQRKKAKGAEEQVYSWMVASQYTTQMRKVIFDSARIGTGVLKGPFSKTKRAMTLNKDGESGIEVVMRDKTFPACSWLDPWNFFPDPSCGENIHDGDYVLELDYLSERQLRGLKGTPGYIGAQIDKVLLEGPDKKSADQDEGAPANGITKRKGRYKVWYFYGAIKREEIECVYGHGLSGDDRKNALADMPSDQEMVYAIVTLVNDSVIKATLNPLDSGEFPYHPMPWQRRAGNWAGIGVGEQIRTAQRMLNAATRAMLNNAGKAAGSQIIVNRKIIAPADGKWTIVPDKIWFYVADMVNADVRAAFMAIDIPIQTDPLLKIINYSLQLAEESTSIPLITQGQSGATTPDTFGAAQLQNNNANQLLRSIGYSVDDNVTEPVTRQYYHWWLMDPDIPEKDKGEFEINAHGSIALVERSIMDQAILQMGPMTLNPAYGVDPKKWMKQSLKSKRLNPEDFQYTPAELQRIESSPPEAPVVTAAKIAADKDIKVAVMGQQSDAQSIASEERIEEAANALEGQKTQVGATVDLHEMENKRQMMILEYALKHGITLMQAKADLAQTSMKLRCRSG
jgi:hypothetical protein